MSLGFTSCLSLESPPSLKTYAFPSDKALCVVVALDCYRERTSIWRKKI